MGKAGVAISFCDESESAYLRDIERLLDRSVPVSRNHPFHSASGAAPQGAVLFAKTGGQCTANGGMLYGAGRGRGRYLRGRR